MIGRALKAFFLNPVALKKNARASPITHSEIILTGSLKITRDVKITMG